MKTVVLSLLLCLSAVFGWSQGTVDFRNSGVTFRTTHDKLVYWCCGIGRDPVTGTNIAAGLFFLYGANAGISVPTLGIQAGGLAFFRQPTTASPGAWLNPASVGTTRILDGVPIGAVATLQVRVWDITRHATFAQAFASGQYGWSDPFNYTVPAAGSAPDAYYLNDLHAFATWTRPLVPEPSFFAIGLAGFALLWVARRRATPK